MFTIMEGQPWKHVDNENMEATRLLVGGYHTSFLSYVSYGNPLREKELFGTHRTIVWKFLCLVPWLCKA